LAEYYRLLVDIEDDIVDTKRNQCYGIGCMVHVYADKIQNQTKIFNYKMRLKYNRKKMNTSLLFFTKIVQKLQFKAIFGKIA